MRNNLSEETIAKNEYLDPAFTHNIVGKIHDELGENHIEQGNFDEALEEFEIALEQRLKALESELETTTLTVELVEQSGDHDIAITYNNLGLIFYFQNNLAEALEHFKMAEKILERTSPNSPDLANTHNNTGLVYRFQGQADEAIVSYQKALVIQEQDGFDSLDLAITHNNIGVAYRFKPDFEEALAHWQEALKILLEKAPDSPHIAITYRNIGEVYKSQNKLDEAFDCYQRALVIQLEKTPNSLSLADTHSQMKEIRTSLSNQEEARANLIPAESLQETKAPNSLDLANTHNYTGKLYQSTNPSSEEALEEFKKASEIVKTKLKEFKSDGLTDLVERAHEDLAQYYKNMGEVLKSQNKFDEAARKYRVALGIQKQRLPKTNIADSYYTDLTEVLKSQGKVGEALELLQESFKAKNEIEPSNPDLLSSAYTISSIALKLNKLGLALEYANIAIQKDQQYKYSHDIKGLILEKQGKHQEALASFGEALAIDPIYADAQLHQLKLMAKGRLFKSEEISEKIDEVIKLHQEHLENSKANEDANDNRELLPKQKYQAGDENFIQRLEDLKGVISSSKAPSGRSSRTTSKSLKEANFSIAKN